MHRELKTTLNATLAFAIDTAKENGFSIDGITASAGEQPNVEDIYTVFMSKKAP